MSALKIRGSRFAPARPRPLPTPDAWAYDWALRAAILLLVGWILPGGTAVMSRYGNTWAWTRVLERDLSYGMAVGMPLLAGLVCLWAALHLKGPARSHALLTASAALALAWFVLTPESKYDLFRIRRMNAFLLPRSREGALYDAGFFVPFAAVAAGCHLRRRFERSRRAGLLCVLGAGSVLTWVLVPIALSPLETDFSGVMSGSLTQAQPLLAALAYALPNILFLPFIRPALHARAFGILHRGALLAVFAILLVGAGMKSAFLVTGALILLPLGPAAWLESRMFAKSHRTDSKALAQVFR